MQHPVPSPGETPPLHTLPWWARWRTILLAAFLLVVLVVGAAEVAGVYRDYRQAEVAALARQSATARVLASATEHFIARYTAIADAALEIFEAPLAPDTRHRLLVRIRRAHPEITSVAALDADGRVLDADPDEMTGLGLAGRAYYRRILAGASAAVSDVVVGDVGKAVVIPVAAASRAPDGSLRGLVVLGLPPEALAAELAISLGGGAYPVVVDREGQVIVHGTPSVLDAASRNFVSVPLIAEALAGRSASSSRFPDPVTGETVLGAVVPMPAFGWAVGVFQPVEKALAPAREELRIAVWVTGAVLGLGVALALILSTWLSRPIAALAEGAAALAVGNLAYRITSRWRSEFGWLAAHFNRMAAGLEAAQREAQALNEELVATNEELQANAAQLEEHLTELEAAQEQIHELNRDLLAANQQLRASEEQFRSLSAASPIGIFLIDAEGRFRYTNPRYRAICGSADEESLGGGWMQLVHEEDRAQVAAQWLPRAREGREFAGEFRLQTAGGGVRWVSVRTAPTFAERGELIGHVGTIEDITDRKQAAEALQEREERYRLVARAANDIIWDWDVPTGQVVWSDALGTVLGYRPEEPGARFEEAYRWWLDIIHPEDRERVAASLEAAVGGAGDVWSAEYRIRRADGVYATVVDRGYIVRNVTGAPVRVLGAMTDITDRKRAEDILRFLAEAAATLASSLDYEVTLQAVARLAVGALADLCLIDVVEPDGRVRRLAAAHADPAREAELREAHGGGAPNSDPAWPLAGGLEVREPELIREVSDTWLEGAARCPDQLGLLRALGIESVMVAPLVTRGHGLGAITLAAAGSGRRYGEADLKVAEELARRVAVAIDNGRLYQEAQAAIRARETFLARAAHELRTPLTSALGTVRWLRRAMSGTVRESPETLVEICNRNLEAMTALVNDLLDASKLAAGQEPLRLESIDLAEVVARSVEVVGPQARDKRIGLETGLPAGLVVSADRLKLEQVLVNLLANAVKFTPAGGRVTVTAEVDREGISLEVRDTGEGIAREHLEAIFEPFFQAGSRGSKRPRGTGLGLAICRQIVELHGGRIRADSEGPGRGSTFTIRLPAA